MPNISEAGGPTDQTQPDYFDQGRTVHSPNVTVTEAEGRYNDAMSRHGTDEFTDEDARVVQEYQDQRKAENAEQDPQAVGNEHLQGTVTAERRDYGTYSYPELQQLCKDRGLSAGGSQDALVERLNENDEK